MRCLLLAAVLALSRAAPAPGDVDPAPAVVTNPCENPLVQFFKEEVTSTLAACDAYSQCANGIRYDLHCPAGLVFNLEKKYCDYGVCENPAGPWPMLTFDYSQLAENECPNGDYIYKRVDATTYEQWSLDRQVLDQVHTCVSGTFMGLDGLDQTKCYCDEVPQAVVQPADPLHACNVWTFEGLASDSTVYVDAPETEVRQGLLPDGVTLNHDLCFSGLASSYQSIPFYDGNDWTNGLAIAFRYRLNDWTLGAAVTDLFTNGDATQDPTVRVAVDTTQDDRLVLSAEVRLQDGTTCSVNREELYPAPEDRPTVRELTTVNIIYSGEKLHLFSGDDHEPVEAVCEGTIATSYRPMKVGMGFHGCMDDINICKSTFNEPLLESPIIVHPDDDVTA